ncbi:uncharacterized protein TNCV_4720231 [Trichonephila clavipes]|uniref:Uncharacterized protein n=1 Tax=Trichonephila clavipes TaxID=2585209 RepID=A0A8X7BFW2_TRICX|nr:uncharacterized protein TNCV_4720231 [Trichonephila clavipes]
MLNVEVGMSVRCLLMTINGGIREIRKFYYRPSNNRNNHGGNYETGRQIDQCFKSRNGLNKDDQRFDRGYQSENRVQSENFSLGDRRNRGSSKNFRRGDQRQGSRINVLRVRDEQNDQSLSVKEVPIKLSAICMSSVELPYVPILLNYTFAKALWDTGAEKSFISEDIYQKYFFYKQVKKIAFLSDHAQGAKCQNFGIIELNVRIKEFVKPWMFRTLADFEYPCILGVTSLVDRILSYILIRKRWRFRIDRLKKLLQRLRKEMWK